jgi:hypothetical protein
MQKKKNVQVCEVKLGGCCRNAYLWPEEDGRPPLRYWRHLRPGLQILCRYTYFSYSKLFYFLFFSTNVFSKKNWPCPSHADSALYILYLSRQVKGTVLRDFKLLKFSRNKSNFAPQSRLAAISQLTLNSSRCSYSHLILRCGPSLGVIFSFSSEQI